MNTKKFIQFAHLLDGSFGFGTIEAVSQNK